MTTNEDQTTGQLPSKISRRTLAAGAAWSVPVIAVASAAPAYALSGGILTLTGTACKLPGNSQSIYKGYAFGLVVNNTMPVSVLVEITSVFRNSDNLGNVTVQRTNPPTCTNLTDTFTVPANTSYNAIIYTQGANNSSNGTITVNYDYTPSGDPTASATATAAFNSAPPIQGGQCTLSSACPLPLT